MPFPHSSSSTSTGANISGSGSSVWSSPNIGQMTEMSQEWYRNMLNDSADLIKNSFDQLDFSRQFMVMPNSQPAPNYSTSALRSIEDTDIASFNSLPVGMDFDFTSCLDDNPFSISIANAFTPITSNTNTSSIRQLSPVKYYPNPLGNKPKHEFSSRVISSRGRKYQNTNLLAQYCQEVLCETAHPDLNQIDGIVSKLKNNANNTNVLPDKKVRSSIREWFRKRREYMATKIYRSCQRLLPNRPEKSEEVHSFIKQIHKKTSLLGIIMLEAKLPMQSEEEKLEFVKEKIVDYYLKYPQRKMRNTTGFKVHKIMDKDKAIVDDICNDSDDDDDDKVMFY